MTTIALLPGDGVGPEVLAGPNRLLDQLSRAGVPVVATGPWPVGARAFADHGSVLPDPTVAACEAADLVLFGAVGDDPSVGEVARPELALVRLREHFGLAISIRHVWRPGAAPLVFVRNLLGGAYVADDQRHESDGRSTAVDPTILERARIESVVDVALDLRASGEAGEGTPLLSVDKANLLATSRLWRRVVAERCAARGVAVRHVLVDRFGFELAAGITTSGTVVTEGLFGDILSDVAAGRVGSIALCGSASVTPADAPRRFGLFEPVHGSAPRLAGRGRANPTGAYLALAAALEWGGATAAFGPLLRQALHDVVARGVCTYDLAAEDRPPASTVEFSTAVNERFAELWRRSPVPAPAIRTPGERTRSARCTTA